LSGDPLIPPSPTYDPSASPPPDDAAFFAESGPFELFARWLQEARENEINDPNAMALATADDNGVPDVRMVLLKDFSSEGFGFYTNAESAKGRQLEGNANAAILFYWKSLRRQVRVRGPISFVSDEEADAYFRTRDRGARLGAWASAQSRPLADRAALEAGIAAFDAKFADKDVPRPAYWRGYRLTPLSFEFWRDRPFRLHDRLSFTRATGQAPWAKSRLSP
jgi:pyridoxamine 5'-phosphate oxidase